jgi:hypothetical protein
MDQTAPLLAPLADWHIGALLAAVPCIYGAIFICNGTRRFAKKNVDILNQGLPSLGDATTLVGLLLAALAILATTNNQEGIERFHAAFLFVGVGILSLFGFQALRPHVSPWTVYFSEAMFGTTWYAVAWGVFALVDSLIPSSTWRLSLLSAPAMVVAASVYSGWLKIRSS